MGKTGIVGLAKIVADTTQGKVHFCKAVGGGFLFLTVDVDAVDIALLGLDKGGTLDEHTAGAAAGVYKDAVFDTSPVAGKVYKNSENRRKQGVFWVFSPYLLVFNLSHQCTAEVCLVLASGLLRGRLREKLKSISRRLQSNHYSSTWSGYT